jgi:hypothetical protein
MTIPNEVRSHHTVWLDLPGGRTRALRYVTDGERLICRGDDGLAGVPAGATLFASLRGLACGPLERYFRVSVREVDGAELGLGTLAELLGDTPLGRNTAEVEATLEALRSSRRFVALEA